MARIAGVNIPTNKRVGIALQYIHGIGPKKAEEICEKVHIPAERRVAQLLGRGSAADPRDDRPRLHGRGRPTSREVAINIKRLMDLGAYRGLPSPQAAAGPRPAHAHQRAHPQGQGQAHRRQEEVIVFPIHHFQPTRCKRA